MARGEGAGRDVTVRRQIIVGPGPQLLSYSFGATAVLLRSATHCGALRRTGPGSGRGRRRSPAPGSAKRHRSQSKRSMASACIQMLQGGKLAGAGRRCDHNRPLVTPSEGAGRSPPSVGLAADPGNIRLGPRADSSLWVRTDGGPWLPRGVRRRHAQWGKRVYESKIMG